jgi:hypothetical protein
MNIPANIRVNAAFPFPAQVAGSGPISIAKQSGVWTVGYDVSRFVPTTPPPSALATDYTLVWDSVAKTFINVPLSALGSGGGAGAGTAIVYDTAHGANSLASAHVPTSANIVQTGGYARAGDGGGAFYYRVGGAAPFPSYAVTDADGHAWQYIPEPSGWNAKVAGVVADGATEDGANLMKALLPFQDPTYIVGGGNLSGALILPAGVMKVSSAVIVAGNNGTGLDLLGQSAGNQSAANSTTLQWHGTASYPGNYPSMFIVYAANNFHSVGVNYDGSAVASALLNCVHFTADNTYRDTLGVGVAAAAGQTFQVTSTAGLFAGTSLGIGQGTPNFEIIYIKSVTDGTHFVADCRNPHGAEVVGGGFACNSLFVEKSTLTPQVSSKSTFQGHMSGSNLVVEAMISGTINFADALFGHGIAEGSIIGSYLSGSTPGGVGTYATTFAGLPTSTVGDVLSTCTPTTAILCGTPLNPSVQAAEFTFHNCNFISPVVSNGIGIGYSGIRMIGGGNIKNYTIDNCSFLFLRYGIAGESCSGNIKITYPTFLGTALADIMANNGNLTLDNMETEGGGQRMLVGSGGATPQNATLTNCQFQSGLPADFYVIKWAGSLTLINNLFDSAIIVQTPAFTASINGFFMSVTGISSGVLAKGQTLNYPGVVSGTIIVDGPGGGGPGTYTVSKNQGIVASQSMTSTDATYQKSARIQSANVWNGLAAGLNPAGIASIGNYFQFGGPLIPVFYDGSDHPYNFGAFVTDPTQSLWNVFQINDYGEFGCYNFSAGRLVLPTAAMSGETVPTGISIQHLGYISEGVNVIQIPYTYFSGVSSSSSPYAPVIGIPPKAFITAVIADVVQGFSDASLTLKFGDIAIDVAGFLKPFNAHTAGAFGLLDTDIGSHLARQSNTNADVTSWGWSGGWAGTQSICMQANGSANLNTLTQGKVNLYIVSKRFN